MSDQPREVSYTFKAGLSFAIITVRINQPQRLQNGIFIDFRKEHRNPIQFSLRGKHFIKRSKRFIEILLHLLINKPEASGRSPMDIYEGIVGRISLAFSDLGIKENPTKKLNDSDKYKF